MSFCHLHSHTEYSLLDGTNKIKDYVSRAKELGQTAAAITDHGVMYGVIDFYKECAKQGIKPILGCEVYVAPGSRFDKTKSEDEERYYHLILLAENNTGYQNLVKIVSSGFIDGFYYKPRVDSDLLKQYHEGLICLSACLAGEVPRKISAGRYEEAKETALLYRDIFGENNYFLELQDHGLPEQKGVNTALVRMSKETGIPLAATNDCHYTLAEDARAHEVLLCLQTQKKMGEPHLTYPGGQYYVKSEEEMLSLFPYAKDAVYRTQEIADRCGVEIAFHESKLPKYHAPAPYTSEQYLTLLSLKGFSKRYPDAGEDLFNRLRYELSTIKSMGYVDYFLIVWDFINYARENGIAVGPGRGSAAGSIVSYSLGITNIDPVKYGLIFERFLNPERVSMPDIDVDFCVDRRGEVIDYVTNKYGSDCVAQIVTFGTLGARGVLRDVGRVMDLPYSYTSNLAKMVPKVNGITIDEALEMNPDFKAVYDNDPSAKALIDMSKKLEGLPRNSSTHAAGVVISGKPMQEYVPLARSKEGKPVVQFNMTTVEELGLLKMDFLGLRNLTVIQNAVRLIKGNRGDEINIDSIGASDPAVYKSISSGRVDGVFQLESSGMKGFMRELKPSCLEDLIAGIALYRPGPMDFIPAYIKGKENPSAIKYDCPQLEPILKETYGCIVYQEQVMRIVRDLAGYSLGRSDLVRRAMSKKKADVMEKERLNFVYGNKEEGIPGCISNGIPEETANHIYDEMTDFAKYAFNKSHAAAYAVITYQTAWLKLYYPAEYYAALMSSKVSDLSKVADYMRCAIDDGVKILPPDVNRGEQKFSVDGDNIIYSLSAIKGVGSSAVSAVMAERSERGPFKSLDDFCRRTSGKGVNKRVVENMIKAGAFDYVGINRSQALSVYEDSMKRAASFVKKSGRKNVSGQLSLFDVFEIDEPSDGAAPNIPEFPMPKILEYEKEVLGLYLSGHPLDDYRDVWDSITNVRSSELKLDDETGECPLYDGTHADIGGLITDVSVITTKKGDRMAFVTAEDFSGSYESIFFPKTFDKYKGILSEGAKILIRGRVSAEDNKDSKIIADDAELLPEPSREYSFAEAER